MNDHKLRFSYWRDTSKLWLLLICLSIIAGLNVTIALGAQDDILKRTKVSQAVSAATLKNPGETEEISSSTNYETTVDSNKLGCVMMDGMCIAHADVSSYEAIKALHAHLDDDQSGDIDLSESVDFLREELNYTKGLEKRQKAFHHNNDQHISVRELWEIWLSNEVHNWTVEQTVGWLSVCVELGQYADVFYENAINGSLLPRLATNNDQFLSRILGIKNPTHKSKISIKAMDIVLFGPPKETGSLVKDIFIASLIFVIFVLLFKFNRMSRTNNKALKKMDQEMETLLEELRKFQDKAMAEDSPKKEETEQGSVMTSEEKEGDGDKDPWEPGDPKSSDFTDFWETNSAFSSCDFLERDLGSSKTQLLQLWLQLTYEREKVNLSRKLEAINAQIEEAKDMCERLKPNRKNLFGALSFVHGRMDSKGHPLLQAKSAFGAIQRIKEEMNIRWSAMEEILRLPITQNLGVGYLERILEPTLHASTTHTANSNVGLASAALERGSETPTPVFSRPGAGSETLRRRKLSNVRGSSILSEVSVNLDSSGVSTLLSADSTRVIPRTSSLLPSISHSNTIGTGLSSHGKEDIRPRSSSSEGQARKLSNASHLGISSTRSFTNGYSTDETDSAKFSVGDSAIKIDPSSAVSRVRNTPPHSPSASLRGRPSERESSLSPPEKVELRTHHKRLHQLGKSYSQDEKGSLLTGPEKKIIGKYLSEPTLETQESSPTSPEDSTKAIPKKGLLTKPKFFSKLKPNPKKSPK